MEAYDPVAIQQEEHAQRDQDSSAHQSVGAAAYAVATAISDIGGHRDPPIPGWVVRL